MTEPSGNTAPTRDEASYNHILKYTGLLGGVQVFYVLMAVVRNKLTALFIGAAGMGLADLYARTAELVGNTTNLGIGFSAVRRLSALYEEGDTRRMGHYVRLIRTWTLLTALLGGAACAVAAPLLSRLTTGGGGHTADYALLAPAVAFATLTGGELAVLKGIRRLKAMAAISAVGALATLLITAPLYWLMGTRGIVPVLVLTAAATFALNCRAATRHFPYRVTLLRRRFLRQGGHLVRLGGAYIVAGIFGSGAEMALRACLSRSPGGLEAVGLYAAGFTLTVSYARIIFVAMDADYFPRLSAAVADRRRLNLTANRQIDVLVLLIVPFLIAFAMALPLIVRLLYTTAFLGIVPMVVCAAGYMFFKAVFSPVAYLPLAAGHALTYMAMELAYDVPFVLLVIGGYRWGGLAGAGLGLSLAGAYNLLLVWACYARRYGFRPAAPTLRRCLVQGLWLVAGLVAAWQAAPLPRYGLGAAALLLSLACSWRLLMQETALGRIAARFRHKHH